MSGEIQQGNGHTPGPWAMETVGTSVGSCHKIGRFPARAGDTYACVYADGIGVGQEHGSAVGRELLANARLIAAAPELLAALEDVHSFEPDRVGECLACTAMAKARGIAND